MGHHHHHQHHNQQQQQQQYEEMQDLGYRSSNYYLHEAGRSRTRDQYMELGDIPANRTRSLRTGGSGGGGGISGGSPSAHRWRSLTESEGRIGGGAGRRSRDRSSSSSSMALHQQTGSGGLGMDSNVTPKISDFFTEHRCVGFYSRC